jgi:hypothetical protein
MSQSTSEQYCYVWVGAMFGGPALPTALFCGGFRSFDVGGRRALVFHQNMSFAWRHNSIHLRSILLETAARNRELPAASCVQVASISRYEKSEEPCFEKAMNRGRGPVRGLEFC